MRNLVQSQPIWRRYSGKRTDPAATPIETLERGIVTVNTETAEALGLDYSMFKDMCSEVVETVTAEEFE